MRNLAIIFFAVSLIFVGMTPDVRAQGNPAMQNPAIQNPAVRSPVTRGTTPISSYQDSLVRTPNPIDTSGNLIVTGNVGGGRHFRGIVPYNATSDFGGRLGTSPMDDFLRRSAGISGYSDYTFGNRPYYFERRTVTGTEAGSSQIYRPPMPKVSYNRPAGLLEPSLAEPQVLRIPPITTRDMRLRPLSMTTEEFEEAIARDLEKYPQYLPPEKVSEKPAEELSEEEYEEQMDKLRQNLKDLSEKTAELKQSLLIKDKAEEKPEIPPSYEQARRPLEMKEEEKEEQESKEPDIYGEMDRQSEEFRKMLEERRVKAEEEAKKEAEQAPKQKKGEEETKKPLLEGLSRTDLAIRARGILGEHETFEAFAAERFKEHMEYGAKYLKEGKYYRSADSYTMASLYNRSDPKAYAGKSYALFAAGEYMSSALFLSRALEASPEYASEKVDIVAVIGDRDKIESRVADAEQWFKRSGAPELEFLLSYMYYRLGRMPQAKAAINEAFEKMPESAAVAALKKAIESGSN